jgi:selenophosphate synthase
VHASATIDLPIAKMPPKYASWVVEAQGYLEAVNTAYDMQQRATADLAAAIGVEANANAIANFIHNSIKVKTTLECTPPSFNASMVGECTASASARAAGNAGNGGAAGSASAGIQANCEAKASLSLSPGHCTMKTTVTQDPILSDPARWEKMQANMAIILQLDMANEHLNGRGGDINVRGMQLYVQSVTDLASDPTLALQLNNIQAELKKGSDACGKANDKQAAMNNDLNTMAGAIDAQFPDLRASVKAG